MSMPKMKKNKTVKKEGDERWSKGLPQHVLQLIPERLQISDYQSFRHVCNTWRGAIENGIATKTCSPAPQLPWLLLRSNDCRQAFSIEQSKHSLVRNPNIFRSVAASFSHPNCIGSIGAWLIIAAERNLNNNIRVANFFLNPISGAQIMLPSQSTIQSHLCNDLYFFKKVVASSDPVAQPQNCLVAGFSSDGVYICRPTDASCNNLVKGSRFYKVTDIEILDDKFYAVVVDDTGHEFIAAHEDERFGLEVSYLGIRPSIDNWKWRACCLVSDSQTKELFLILHRIPVYRQNQKEGLFRVFSRGLSIGDNWTEVFDLGDRMLFVSETSNKCIHDETLGRNCVYFAFDFRGGFGMYSMESRRMKPLVFRKERGSNIYEATNQTLWFTPHPW